MLKKIRRNFWNIVCVIWSVAIALFWFAMRVIWSGISKVLFEAAGLKEPTEFFMNLPLYINILLWVIAAFALLKLVRRNRKKALRRCSPCCS